VGGQLPIFPHITLVGTAGVFVTTNHDVLVGGTPRSYAKIYLIRTEWSLKPSTKICHSY